MSVSFSSLALFMSNMLIFLFDVVDGINSATYCSLPEKEKKYTISGKQIMILARGTQTVLYTHLRVQSFLCDLIVHPPRSDEECIKNSYQVP